MTRAETRRANVRPLASLPLGTGRRNDDSGAGKRSSEQQSNETPVSGGSLEIYNIVKPLAKLGIENENERRAAASTEKIVCQLLAGKTEQTEGDDARARRGLHEQRLGGESGLELQGTNGGQETRCHVPRAAGALDGHIWTEELCDNLNGAAAPDQLLEVMRFLKNEGEKCQACQEGKNTDKVDMKDQPGTRWIFCPARRDLAEAFQSLVALELQEEWWGVTFLEDIAPASQAAKEVMSFVRPSGAEATEQGTKSKELLERNKLDRSRNPGQMVETEATHGTQRQYSSTALLHAVLTSSTFSAT